MSPGPPANNIAARLRLTGELRPELLEQALTENRAILRTRFVTREGEPRQLVEPEVHLEAPVIDLQGAPENRRGRRGRGCAHAL